MLNHAKFWLWRHRQKCFHCSKSLVSFPLLIPSSLQLHSPTSTFRPDISGFVHSVDKRPVEEIPRTLRFFATLCPAWTIGLWRSEAVFSRKALNLSSLLTVNCSSVLAIYLNIMSNLLFWSGGYTGYLLWSLNCYYFLLFYWRPR